jgi:4-amino-4-deoxy-L-arabinose transferase-like glycosyltransferase
MTTKRYSHWWIFLILAVLVLAVRLGDLSCPLERDEGEYALAAQQLLRGEVPYLDSFCQKPPLAFLWYLLSFRIFGATVCGIHAIMILAALLSAFALYLVVLEWLDRGETTSRTDQGIALASALVFAVASAGGGYFGSAANTEIFMLVPVLLGCWLLLKIDRRQSATNWFLVGLSLAAGLATKQVALFSFLGPLLFVLLRLARRMQIRFSHLAAAVSGFAAVTLPLVGWLWLKGALGAFLQIAVWHNLSYVGFPFGIAKWQQLLALIAERFPTEIALWAGVPIFLALSLRGRTGSRADRDLFVLLWFGSSLLGVALGPYTFGHYFLQLLPVLCLVGGGLLAKLLSFRKLGNPFRYGLAALALGLVIIPDAYCRVTSLEQSPEERSYRMYSLYGPSPFAAAAAVGQFIGKNSAPDDRVLVVGSEPEILFHADRRSSTRYTIFYPLTGPYPQVENMIVEMFSELERHPPKMIVLVLSTTSFITGNGRLEQIMSQLERILPAGYHPVATVGADPAGHVLWKREGQNSSGDMIPLMQIYAMAD